MATLPSDRLIPHPVAKRLAREFGITELAECGAIRTEDVRRLLDMRPPADCKDQHAWYADRRALGAYMVAVGPCDPQGGWSGVMESRDQVPWAYGRLSL